MCGVVGVIDLANSLSPESLERLVVSMRDLMPHRGPDDVGVWVDATNGCALGHRRLAIIDLSPDGRQPMGGVGVDTVVAYNGEIYNFESIKARLVAQGRKFRSRSDTEILPHLFADLDPGPLSILSGMFAIAVWNPRDRRLLLARDAFGKKPLYVYEDGRFFAFASEIQAFYALPGFDATIDRTALSEYLLLGYLPGPRTIYERVRQVEPGAYEKIGFDRGGVRPIERGRFFTFAAQTRPNVAGVDKKALRTRLKARLVDAVEQRMISDVPLGAFLSGGVDSSLVVAVVRKELGRPISTFSIGFEDSPDSEHEAAREVAAHLGSDHHDAMLRPDGLAMIERIAGALDQPNGDSSCLPTYLLSEFTRRHVTVALSGDGGDELFGGYGRYRDTLNELSDPELLRRTHGVDPAKATLADLYLSPRWMISSPANTARLLGLMPAETTRRLDQWRSLLNDAASPAVHRMRTIDANVYMPGSVLPKVDRMSMQHSLEVRCPLLDVQFAEIAMGISGDDCWAAPADTKRILKDIAADYLPRAWMDRPKKGFGLPANAWGKDGLLQLCRRILTTSDSMLGAHLDRRALSEMIEAQARPGQFSIYQLWPLATIELWMRAQPAKLADASDRRVAA